VASWPDPRRSQLLLVAWLVAVFAISASRDVRILAGAGLLAALVFWRGLWRCLGRTVRSVVPVTVGLSAMSLAWLRLLGGAWPPLEPFAALALRAAVIGFVTFSVLDRVQLLRALAPFPTLSRLLVLCLAQIHALRLLATESREGLKSRMPRTPGVLELVRGASGITAALFTLSVRNAREIADAMRSRGF
jgi:cobalt/nickel transport system permease protein